MASQASILVVIWGDGHELWGEAPVVATSSYYFLETIYVAPSGPIGQWLLEVLQECAIIQSHTYIFFSLTSTPPKYNKLEKKNLQNS